MDILNIDRLDRVSTGVLRLDADDCVLISNALYQMTKSKISESKLAEYQTIYNRFLIFSDILQYGRIAHDIT